MRPSIIVHGSKMSKNIFRVAARRVDGRIG
jgi:hypothetical protein